MSAIEKDWSGAQRRRHTNDEGIEKTVRISYALTINSVE